MYNRMRLFAVLIAMAGLVNRPVHAAAADAELLTVAGRLESLQNLSVEFNADEFYDPPPDDLNVKVPPEIRGHTRVRRGSEKHREIFNFLHGSVLRTSVTADETLDRLKAEGWPANKKEVWARSEGRAESYFWPAHKTSPIGLIDATQEISELCTIDLALGLRAFRADHYLDAADLQKTKLDRLNNGTVSLSWGDTRGNQHTCVFDKAFGFALRRYTLSSNGQPIDTIECSDFKSINNVFLPMKIVRGRHPGSHLQITIQVQRYQVPDPANLPARFLIVWPKGSSVLDNRSKITLPPPERDRQYTDSDIYEVLRKSKSEPQRLTAEAQRRIDEASKRGPASKPVPPSGN